MIIFGLPVIPLAYERIENGARKSGLTVSVTVIDMSSGQVLLPATTVPELGTTGVYVYSWTHGLIKDTLVEAAYTVGSRTIREQIQLSFSAGASGRGM